MGRWLTATVVTAAAFALSTSICGALILPVFMKDDGIRWGLAGGLGVAVAALAALWGHSFAGSEQLGHTDSTAEAATERTVLTGRGTVRNKISGGIFIGSVIQARDISSLDIKKADRSRLPIPIRKD